MLWSNVVYTGATAWLSRVHGCVCGSPKALISLENANALLVVATNSDGFAQQHTVVGGTAPTAAAAAQPQPRAVACQETPTRARAILWQRALRIQGRDAPLNERGGAHLVPSGRGSSTDDASTDGLREQTALRGPSVKKHRVLLRCRPLVADRLPDGTTPVRDRQFAFCPVANTSRSYLPLFRIMVIFQCFRFLARNPTAGGTPPQLRTCRDVRNCRVRNSWTCSSFWGLLLLGSSASRCLLDPWRTLTTARRCP